MSGNQKRVRKTEEKLYLRVPKKLSERTAIKLPKRKMRHPKKVQILTRREMVKADQHL